MLKTSRIEPYFYIARLLATDIVDSVIRVGGGGLGGDWGWGLGGGMWLLTKIPRETLIINLVKSL